jgi:lysozyme family protein
VNHGIKRANAFLQRAAGVKPDGNVGAITIAKTKLMDDIQLVNSICDQREQFYRQIVKKNPPQVRYLNGWLRRISEMRAFVTDPSQTFT